jgi:hypothetical protein
MGLSLCIGGIAGKTDALGAKLTAFQRGFDKRNPVTKRLFTPGWGIPKQGNLV